MISSCCIAFALGALIASCVGAVFSDDEYPTKVIRIVTSESGSTNDLVSRVWHAA